MPNAEHCLAMADEADRLAAIVSYGRDKIRLRQQAESWREKAMQAARAPETAPTEGELRSSHHGVMDWLLRRRA